MKKLKEWRREFLYGEEIPAWKMAICVISVFILIFLIVILIA